MRTREGGEKARDSGLNRAYPGLLYDYSLGIEKSDCIILHSSRFRLSTPAGEAGLGAGYWVQQFHGTLTDIDQVGLVESFGSESSSVRILLASDAASEGINLHYYCHRMIHFDLPWSLITYVLTIPNDPELSGGL